LFQISCQSNSRLPLWQWFGEGEKYVKAVFSLASKIAPSVVFVDEVSDRLHVILFISLITNIQVHDMSVNSDMDMEILENPDKTSCLCGFGLHVLNIANV